MTLTTLPPYVRSDLAQSNRDALEEAGVACIRLRGAPGCGKTTLLDATLRSLPELRAAVIVSDMAGGGERERLRHLAEQVVDVQTDPEVPVDAWELARALARIDLSRADVVFFEDPSIHVPAPGAELGVTASVGVFSVAGGDDKASKHASLVRDASIIVLNKLDLLPHAPFDLSRFLADVERLAAPGVPIVELSALDEHGMENWLSWLVRQARPTEMPAPRPEWFFG